MARTNLNKLKAELHAALDTLENFEDFTSPVNSIAVSAMWNGKMDGQVIEVAVRESTGHFYRGRITGTASNAEWKVLASDGEIIPSVSADTFVAVRLRFLP